MNKNMGVLKSKRRSSYTLDAIEDGFISFPRIRFGGGPEGGPRESIRFLFVNACRSGLETPDCFLKSAN